MTAQNFTAQLNKPDAAGTRTAQGKQAAQGIVIAPFFKAGMIGDNSLYLVDWRNILIH